MEFNSRYHRTQDKPEKNSGKSLTESQGYVPAKVRIENLLYAGQRLSDYRKQQYDFTTNEIDDDFTDPTRTPGYDMADATQQKLYLESQLKASQTSQDQRRGVRNDKTDSTKQDLKNGFTDQTEQHKE